MISMSIEVYSLGIVPRWRLLANLDVKQIYSIYCLLGYPKLYLILRLYLLSFYI